MIAQRQPEQAPIIPVRRGGVTVLRTHAFLAILVGLALRLLFVLRFPASADDSETYLQLARNWVDHHIYGMWLNGQLVPTDLRTPGYPAFLAGVAMLFRRSARAIMLSQAALDLCTCFLTAKLAAALAPAAARRRVAIAALWIAATCPFVANYTATVLTEVLAAFLTTAALVCFAMGLGGEVSGSSFHVRGPRGSDRWLTPFSLALLGAFLTGILTLVRPESPLLLVVAVPVFALRWWKQLSFRKLALTIAALTGAFLLPIAPWAGRNLVTLHEVQLLSPRYSTMPGEYASVGYFAWTGTWLDRYRDVYLNVWKIGEEPVDLVDLPDEAFDSPQEKTRIAELFEQYNNSDDLDISPEMDRVFAEIARERTRRHPFRTYVQVPFQRALTVWFTPRTELLPIDGKLWPLREQWRDSHVDVVVTAGFGALGYLYVALALGGVWVAWRASRTISGPRDALSSSSSWPNLRPSFWGIALVLAYLFVRTAFLTTVEAPEPRYVIPCYPAVLALAGLFWARNRN
jgi:hypothetical protein